MAGSKSGKGPVNNLNDLDYKTWLRFQKSFDRYEFGTGQYPTDFENIVREYIRFFTKKAYESGPAVILTNIRGIGDIDGRTITMVEDPFSSKVLNSFHEINPASVDYVILQVHRLNEKDPSDTNNLLSSIANALKPSAYATIFCHEISDPYPYIWSFASSCRKSLNLCDEKLLLDEKKDNLPVYALQFRKEEDLLPKKEFRHEIKVAKILTSPQYIIPRPPPRKKEEFKHPAKFPEELIEELILSFTDEDDWVLDVMAGTGSTLVAAYKKNRNGVGIELCQEFYNIAKERINKANPPVRLPGFECPYKSELIKGDARNVDTLLEEKKGQIRYCITSPPYWSMLHNPGSEGQRERRGKGLKLTYSESEEDLGNIHNYNQFISTLKTIYENVAPLLTADGKLTVIVKNVKRNGSLYTLAWDLVDELAGPDGKYDYIGYTLWCQDDTGLKPFAIGHHWVSNILHQYCLHFSVRR
ncbi:MAG TPA: DNA modification methylase [Bacteroidales bacterium]|nr:DNA modification methylase [Bacteroidales bacterium]